VSPREGCALTIWGGRSLKRSDGVVVVVVVVALVVPTWASSGSSADCQRFISCSSCCGYICRYDQRVLQYALMTNNIQKSSLVDLMKLIWERGKLETGNIYGHIGNNLIRWYLCSEVSAITIYKLHPLSPPPNQYYCWFRLDDLWLRTTSKWKDKCTKLSSSE